MAIRIFIDGAAGTTGLEIRERLVGRSEFELIVLDDTQRKSEAARRDALHAADIAILCLPDDAAKESVKLAQGSGTRIIDASSAHRVAEGWTYGFPELIGRDRIAEAQFVSNPGCYPTGFLALVAPLIAGGLLPADWSYVMNAVSGYSGGGKALIERFAAEPDLAFRAYGLGLDHKHLAEMKRHGGLTHDVIFAPSVIRAFRGMLVDIPLHLGAMGSVTADDLLSELSNFYAGSKVVSVQGRGELTELLVSEHDAATDRLELFVCGNAGGFHARLIARLDNLGKGASGAAVQNLNIMAGLDETAGLRL